MGRLVNGKGDGVNELSVERTSERASSLHHEDKT